MNPSTAFATVLVDELVRCGVREAVLAPGSRSAPLAYALHAADAAGRLRLHVRIDERSAGFLALGLAKASALAVPVLTTSGTATANLHPAVLEASEAGVPLIVLTADRPPELRGVGANQTVDQIKMFSSAVRSFVEVGVPEQRVGQVAYWRSMAARAVLVATGLLSQDPGPVQLNCPLREPLVPDEDEAWVEPLRGRSDGEPWTTAAGRSDAAVELQLPARTVVVAGDCGGAPTGGVSLTAPVPVLAEPSSGLRHRPLAMRTYPLVLAVPGFLDAHLPERAVVFGRPTTGRRVQALLRDQRIDVEVVTGSPRWADPTRTARAVHRASGVQVSVDSQPSWLSAWRTADEVAGAAVDEVLDGDETLSEPRIARDLLAALSSGALLVAGSSMPIRDLDRVSVPRDDVLVLSNRGASGIDGTVSTAVGAALAHQRGGGGPAYALLGDLTFLHDANGLVLGPDEARPDLTIVVVDNDGGGIFGLLEQGAPQHAGAFERIFGTPTGVDLGSLCAATGTPYGAVSTADELRAALRRAHGLRVVGVQTSRTDTIILQRRLQQAVDSAVTAHL